MSGKDDSAQKTEDPTPRRIREQREKGQVPRSRELGSFAVTGASVLGLLLAGGAMLRSLTEDLRAALRFDADDLQRANLGLELGHGLAEGLTWMLPLLIATIIGAIVGTLGVGGWNFSTKAWVPDFSRLNPLEGFKRMVSWQGLSELLKGLAKFGLLGALLCAVLWTSRDEILALGRMSWPTATGFGARVILLTLALLTLGLLVIALIDAPFQMWQYRERLKMSLHEVREELKDSEGRPEVKQQIRAQQQALSRRRLREAVPQADVVITNPRHYAVALRYEADSMAAPVLLAKGTGPEAALIRELATEHQIPLVEAPPLARALYRHVAETAAVPAALYLAVAQVLSYVYQLRQLAEAPPQASLATPTPPSPDVPEDWRWDPAD